MANLLAIVKLTSANGIGDAGGTFTVGMNVATTERAKSYDMGGSLRSGGKWLCPPFWTGVGLRYQGAVKLQRQ